MSERNLNVRLPRELFEALAQANTNPDIHAILAAGWEQATLLVEVPENVRLPLSAALDLIYSDDSTPQLRNGTLKWLLIYHGIGYEDLHLTAEQAETILTEDVTSG